MYDFIIQSSSDGLPTHNFSMPGLEDKKILQEYTNYNESDLRVRILDDQARKKFLEPYRPQKIKEFKALCRQGFIIKYQKTYGIIPHPFIVGAFINAPIHTQEVTDESKYSLPHFNKSVKFTF